MKEQIKNKCQCQLEFVIDAPLKQVWDACDNLDLITSYHPTVSRVDLISGENRRAEGVSYRCNIETGPKKGWCTEKITNYRKYSSMTISIPEDSWGLNKILENFNSELQVEEVSPNKTKIYLRNYYSPKGLKGLVFNLFFKPRMKKQSYDTFVGLKKIIEKGYALIINKQLH